jgi:hypothetical protein
VLYGLRREIAELRLIEQARQRERAARGTAGETVSLTWPREGSQPRGRTDASERDRALQDAAPRQVTSIVRLSVRCLHFF